MGLAEIGSSTGSIGSSIGSIGAEVGSIGIGAGVSVAPAIGTIGLVGSGLGRFGEVINTPFSLPINEGPVSSSFLENTMPITTNNFGFYKGSERFNTVVNTFIFEPELNTAHVISEAESILFGPTIKPIVQEIPSIFESGLSDVNLNPTIQTEVPSVFDIGLSDINLDPTIKDSVVEPAIESVVEPVVESVTQESAAFIDPISEPAVQESIASVTEEVSDFVVTPNIPEMIPIFEPQVITTVEPKIYPSLPVGKILIEPSLDLNTETFNIAESVLKAGVKAENEQAVLPKTFVSPISEERLEEKIVEEVVVKEKELDQEKEEEDEKQDEFKLKRVVDEKAAKVRIDEIVEATKKSDSGGEIDGARIVEKLPGQHSKNRSGELNIVDPEGYLFDGSLLATFVRIASEKFVSLQDVYKKAEEIVRENIPVTRGDGKGVKDEDVAKVYKEHKGKVPPAIEVIKRVIKIKKLVKIPAGNQNPQVIEEVKKEENEGSIQDHKELAKALKAD